MPLYFPLLVLVLPLSSQMKHLLSSGVCGEQWGGLAHHRWVTCDKSEAKEVAKEAYVPSSHSSLGPSWVFCSWDFLGLECPKLGTLALSFLWLVVNRFAFGSLLCNFCHCGAPLVWSPRQCRLPLRDVRMKVEEGRECCLVLFSNLVLRRHPTKWKFQGPEWSQHCVNTDLSPKGEEGLLSAKYFYGTKNAFTAPNVPGWMGVVEQKCLLALPPI